MVAEKRERLSRKSKAKKVDYIGELQLQRNDPISEEGSKQHDEAIKLQTKSTPHKENSRMKNILNWYVEDLQQKVIQGIETKMFSNVQVMLDRFQKMESQ